VLFRSAVVSVTTGGFIGSAVVSVTTGGFIGSAVVSMTTVVLRIVFVDLRIYFVLSR
jgi:hypothetical protein